MKKLLLLPFLCLLLACLCTTAMAASIPSQQPIDSISDVMGDVTTLTDDDPATAWIKPGQSETDLIINMYGGSVGEIWIRSGYAYTQNWYNHYDRPDLVMVKVYYRANQYTASFDTYRYRLQDLYQPHALTETWINGYQRLLLPKKYTGVTKIELTIESSIRGYGNAGLAISDIIVAGGSHATATPKAYATATPKPYTVYVTPTHGPEIDDDLVEYLTPVPDNTDEAEYIPPVVELITPTPTPYVELITPVPEPTATPEPLEYPSDGGVLATLSQRAATRSGPGNRFDEPGSFHSAGHEVKVFTKGWDKENNLWWFQIEFEYGGVWYRAYTPETRVDVDPAIIPTEPDSPFETDIARDTRVYFGPGTEYKEFRHSVAYEDYDVFVYVTEGDWAQIEYYDYATEAKRRGWVPLKDLQEQPPENFN